MNADTFTAELRKCTPEKDKLASLGIVGEAAARMTMAYGCSSRRIPPQFNDPLLDLVSRYDVSGVEIGIVQFGTDVEEMGELWRVGKAEADPLCVMQLGGEVRVYELGTTHLLWKCARDGASFLDAVLESVRFLDAQLEDQGRKKEMAARCADLAGGDAYLQFYQMLLGYDG